MAGTDNAIRVRMAPGPTGPFHVGRTRTALLNWLFARHHGGSFVLRIEDTDRERSKPEHLQGILDSLRWLGLDWDEGPDVGGPYAPYFQMGRLATYGEYAARLVATGNAYRCYCSPEELRALREEATAAKRPFRYPRTCRYLAQDERDAREGEGRSAVLRLAIPVDGTTSWHDMALGEISYENSQLDDFIIMRGDGIPLYNFAVVIDDITMDITDVIRGQDHVSNTPRQILIYQALDARQPRFAHTPLVVGLEEEKISARHGAKSVSAWGDENGYLPDAVVNYLATIGISYGEGSEIYSREELIRLFDLNKVSKSRAKADDEKLLWMNGVYIRNLPREEFVRRSLPYLQMRGLVSTPPTDEEVAYAGQALTLEQERVRTLAETPDAVEFFLTDHLAYDPALLVQKKSTHQEALMSIHEAIAQIERTEDFSRGSLESLFYSRSDELPFKRGVFFGAIRVAVTGRTAAPPLFDTLEVLGRERVLDRLRRALEYLHAWDPAPEPVL